jgi:hypothetical protein
MLTLAASMSHVATSYVPITRAVRLFKCVLLRLYVFALISSTQRLAAGETVVLAEEVAGIALSGTGLLFLAAFDHIVVFYGPEIQK